MLRLPFFPFLNLVAVFIVIGIGADDVFVLTDQWKQARARGATVAPAATPGSPSSPARPRRLLARAALRPLGVSDDARTGADEADAAAPDGVAAAEELRLALAMQRAARWQ